MALSLDSVGRYVFVCAFSRPVRVHVRCSAALAVSGMELHHSILFLLSWTGPVSYRCILSCSMKNGKRLSHCFCGLFLPLSRYLTFFLNAPALSSGASRHLLDAANVLRSPTAPLACPHTLLFLGDDKSKPRINSGTTGCVSVPLLPLWVVWPGQQRQQLSL